MFERKDKVIYTGNNKSCYFPDTGTEGTILHVDSVKLMCKVQWPIGSTSQDDIWYCSIYDLEKVGENNVQ